MRLQDKFSELEESGQFAIEFDDNVPIWSITNRGREGPRLFRLSNDDIIKSIEELLDNWEEWEEKRLNVCAENPDTTLKQFAATHFKPGANWVLANDQRRSFLTLLSTIVFLASEARPFDEAKKAAPLPKKQYEEALLQLKNIRSKKRTTVEEHPKANDARSLPGVNQIFYGAPGTGKSHRVNELSGPDDVRTVFHPDTQNSDFVGALKPVMDGDKITYKFSPGPFAVALARAVQKPDAPIALIVEELNRAPAAAVFGELFLLLDRDEDGVGKYDCDFPNEEFRKWFQNETTTAATKLRLPSNLSIYATMNSADQGVYPLDTAFRRRWVQEYIHINYDDAPKGKVSITTAPGHTEAIDWASFVEILNEHLTSLGHIQEDRLVGPWFLLDWELSEKDPVPLPGKLLIYLWDDLLRHDGRNQVFATDTITTYGSLSAAIPNKVIFAPQLLAKIKAKIPVVGSEKNVES